MRKLFVILFIVLPVNLFAQDPALEKARAIQEKLETILRLQDLRTVHDGKLFELLTDKEYPVRRRATYAFGSIQDTNAIPSLVVNLWDKEEGVQSAAAWAIGQTGSLLSYKSRQMLEHDLIWTRIDQSKVADKLIEELGKFGTEQALSDLVLRFGTNREYSKPLMMSIARFAIRGIVTREAVQFLIQFIKPADTAPWQAVYAMQRIGNNDELRNEIDYLIPLYRHDDPLVRMNLATLLGKIKDEAVSLDPLWRMAEFDHDWRVQINAIKALGGFHLKQYPASAESYRRLFVNENIHVVTTALASFGSTGIKEEDDPAFTETFSAVKRIAENKDNQYLWQVQAEAAMALAKLSGDKAMPYIHLSKDYQPQLLSRLITAIGFTGAPSAKSTLLPYVRNDNPLISRSALEGLQELSKRVSGDKQLIVSTYDAAIAALKREDVAIVTTAASILGDSLFQQSGSVEPLIETLANLRVPDDVEAMQEIISTLGKLGDRRAEDILQDNLSQRDRSVAVAAANALHAITGGSYLGQVAIGYEPLYVDFDFAYLNSLPDRIKVRVATLRGDFVMELFKDVAPFTVMSFLKLATQRGFYNGLKFHRIVPNFVIQGGDPRGDGWGGAGYAIRSEFSPLRYETGTIGVASAGKDTEGSQFFITQSPQPHLDGRYTIFGRVVEGMEVVNKILLDDTIHGIEIVR